MSGNKNEEVASLLVPKLIDNKNLNENSNNKISKYIYIVAFSIIATIGHKSSINATQINVEKEISEETIKTGDIIDGLLSIESNEKKLINKEGLDKLYDLYKKSSLPEKTNNYIREVILNTYIKMLEDGYSIDGHRELDKLREKISNLSVGKIEIVSDKSLPNSPEFDESIIIVGTLEENIITIKKRGLNLDNKDLSTMEINKGKLLEAISLDIPNDIEESIKTISDLIKTKDYLEEKIRVLSREYSNNQSNYEIKISNLYKEITQLISDKKKLEESHKLELEKLEDIHKQELKTKQEEFEKERNELNSKISSKNNEISSTKKANNEAIKEIKHAHRIAILKLEKKLSEEKKYHETEIEKKEEEKSKLKSDHILEKENLNKLSSSIQKDLNSTIDSLKKEIDKLNQENNLKYKKILSLTDTISRLFGEKTSLQKELEELSKKYSKLLQENKDLEDSINPTELELERTKKILGETKSELEEANKKIEELRKKLEEERIGYVNKMKQILMKK